MSKLKNLSNIKRDFMRFELWGNNNELCEEVKGKEGLIDFIPLIVVGNPPDSTFVVGSKMMTSFISSHVEDFSKLINQIKSTKDEGAKKAMVKQMQNELTDSVMKEFENPADIFQKTTMLGKEYLLLHCDHCFYVNEPNVKVPLRFVETEEEKEALLASEGLPKDCQVLTVNLLSQDDLTLVGTQLLDGKTKRTPIARIPVLIDNEGGESSIPADELGKFPSSVGTNAIQNVSSERDSG